MTRPVLALRGLGFAYPEAAVFSGWSIDIGPGVTWVVGDEGSGKTTLVKLLAGELAGAGEILLDGEPLQAGAAARRPQVAWVDARDERADGLGVGEFFAAMRASCPAFDPGALDHHVAGFALTPHVGKSLFQLSTGTRRKVGLAAMLAAGARLTLLDDPTAALDGPSVGHLMHTLAGFATHPSRAWIVTGYEPPPGVPGASVVRLPPRR